MKRTLLFSLALGACGGSAYNAQLSIREAGDASLFAGVTSLVVTAERDGQTVAQSTYAASARKVAVTGVPFATDVLFTLDGLSSAGDVVARGSSCPIDFTKQAATVPLYFAPTEFFAVTPGAPPAQRTGQMPIALPDGDVVLLGGMASDVATASSLLYTEASASFTDAPAYTLSTPRAGGESSQVSVGTLLTGGVDASGVALDSAELFLAQSGQLMDVENQALGARAQHRATVLPPDRVLLTGGVDATGAVLGTSAVVSVQSDGTVQVVAGPPLAVPRSAHAALVAVGTPVLIGGYGADHKPLTSIEVLDLADDGDIGTFHEVAQLSDARAEATATLLGDGSILVVGGVGADGTPRDDAEVYNPLARTTRSYTLGTARHGHTATLLPNGRVLIVGGLDVDNNPIKETELFIVDVGFVSENPLQEARAGHIVQPLCDGSMLVEGGAADAELYVPAVD